MPINESAIETDPHTWNASAEHVQRALKFIRRRGGTITPEELVAWDATHGRHLFEYDSEQAAEAWRLHQARLFLNSFRETINGLRVRAFINIPGTEETGLDGRQYVASDVIGENTKMRKWVIDNIVRRMSALASELRMWKLDATERRAIIRQLWEKMSQDQDKLKRAS